MRLDLNLYFPFFCSPFVGIWDMFAQCTYLHTRSSVYSKCEHIIKKTHNQTQRRKYKTIFRQHSTTHTHTHARAHKNRRRARPYLFCDPVKDYDVIHSILVECGNISHIRMRQPNSYVCIQWLQ